MSATTKSVDVSHLLERYAAEERQGALMGLLQDIQEELGYLPVESLEAVSKHLKIPLSHIHGVISFYAQFSLTPRGKNIIKMCMGTACHIRGGQMVLDEIRSYLGLNGRDTTEDNLFSLEVVRCLGTCFLAPVMMIGKKYYGKLTTAKVRKILKSYQS
jgi:NADH:ubiquinone oxidoreductase subunit E